ncbi:hypothetical protein LguiA_027857 [Lonicera macranthoides]
MDPAAEEEYVAFEKKVKRTVYIDNLSPKVTEAVLESALNQFGNVKNVQFIPNYLEPKSMPRAALVEMEKDKQVSHVIEELANYPFMMSGMPRPVRACAAEMEMFDDRPKRPGRRIQCHWLDPKDPDFEVAQKIKRLVRKHSSEASYLLKQQLAEEEKLSNQQAETLKTNYKKYELIDNIIGDGTARRLAQHYNMNITDA